MCTYLLLKLLKLFQYFKVFYHGFLFSNWEKYFTIAGINTGTWEIIYIPAGLQVLGSGSRKTRQLVSKGSCLHLVVNPFHSRGMEGMTDFDKN